MDFHQIYIYMYIIDIAIAIYTYMYIFNGTHLVDVQVALGVGQRIEDCVELVEHFHNFHGALGIRVGRAVLAKAHNAGEHQRYGVVAVKINRSIK